MRGPLSTVMTTERSRGNLWKGALENLRGSLARLRRCRAGLRKCSADLRDIFWALAQTYAGTRHT